METIVYLEDIGDKKYRPEGSKKEYNVKGLLGTVDIRRKEENLLEEILDILNKKREDENLMKLYGF